MKNNDVTLPPKDSLLDELKGSEIKLWLTAESLEDVDIRKRISCHDMIGAIRLFCNNIQPDGRLPVGIKEKMMEKIKSIPDAKQPPGVTP